MVSSAVRRAPISRMSELGFEIKIGDCPSGDLKRFVHYDDTLGAASDCTDDGPGDPVPLVLVWLRPHRGLRPGGRLALRVDLR